MRKSIVSLSCFVCLAVLPGLALAGVYTFQPSDRDLDDLDHSKYYTWGINWTVPAGEVVNQASLSIHNLNDWQVENGDSLYIHLLDNPALGIRTWTDNEDGGDAFAGQGTWLTTYTDDDPWPNPAEDWNYNFLPSQVQALRQYVSDGRFGLGFDPDCRYYNDGIKLTITTECLPEPGTAVLVVSALGFCGRLIRKRCGQA